MEVIKSILILIFLFSLLSFSTDATFGGSSFDGSFSTSFESSGTFGSSATAHAPSSLDSSATSFESSGTFGSSVTAHAPSSLDSSATFNLQASFMAELAKCITFPPLPLTPVPPSLFQACSVAENRFKCMSFIAPFLTKGGAEPVSVLQKHIEALHKVVLRAKSVAKKISMDASTSSKIRSCLDTCVQYYDDASNDLARASTACSAHDISLVNTMLGGAISHFGNCDETFSKNGLSSLMKEVDQTMIELAGYGLDISTKYVYKVNF